MWFANTRKNHLQQDIINKFIDLKTTCKSYDYKILDTDKNIPAFD